MSDWNTRHRPPSHLAVLDGCCGIGGITRGLTEAGHDVWGVDSNPALEEDYLRSGAMGFICADILDVLEDDRFMRRFDAASLSPPCQGYSGMSNCRPGLAGTYPRLIAPVRERADRLGIPYVIENVSRARPEMLDPMTVCMWGNWGRETYRHRLVEAGGGFVLNPPPAPPDPHRGNTVKPNWECGWPHPVAAAKAGHWTPGKFVSVSGHERKEPVRRVMEIDWARKREDVVEAVPPYVGFWLGQQLAMM